MLVRGGLADGLGRAWARGFPRGRVRRLNDGGLCLRYVGAGQEISVRVGRGPGGRVDVCVRQFDLLSRHLEWCGRDATLRLEGGGRVAGGRLGGAGLSFGFGRGCEAEALALVEGIASIAARAFRGEALAAEIAQRVAALDPAARVRAHGSGVNVRYDDGGAVDVYVYSDGDAEVFFGSAGEFEQFMLAARGGGTLVALPDGQRHRCERVLDPDEREACFVCHFPLAPDQSRLLAFIEGVARVCSPLA